MRYLFFFLFLPLISFSYPIIQSQYSTKALNSLSLVNPSYSSSSTLGSSYRLGLAFDHQLSKNYSLGLNTDFYFYSYKDNINSDLKIQNKYFFKTMNKNSFYALASPVLKFRNDQKTRLSLDLGIGYQWLFGKEKNYSFGLGATTNISKGEIAVSPTLGIGLRF